MQSRISRTPYHPIGGPMLSQGPNIQARHHLAPPKKLWPPKLKYEAPEISEVGGPFERIVLIDYSYFDPFESNVFTHCNCCWGPPWKQSSLLIQYITIAVGPLWKQGTLHITAAIGGPFESVVSLLTHYICYWASHPREIFSGGKKPIWGPEVLQNYFEIGYIKIETN